MAVLRRETGATLPGVEGLAISQKLKNIATSIKEKFSSNNQKATDKLFARLKVGNVQESLFVSAPYKKWTASVAKAYKTNPKAGRAAVFSTLAARYDDEALAKLLVEAKQVRATREPASEFQAMQIDSWAAKQKTTDDIYSALKLEVNEKDLLKNPLLDTWISYIPKAASENPYNLVLRKLMNHYDDQGLAQMLIAAKEDSRVASIATKVEESLLKRWQSDGKTADDVFRLLRLNDDKSDYIMKNPVLSTWISYVDQLHEKNPYDELVLMLTKSYGEGGLADILVATRTDFTTRSMAIDFENALIKKWSMEAKAIDDAFNLLRLRSDNVEETLRNPALITWISYVKKSNKDPYELLFRQLDLRAGDAHLAKMLALGAKSNKFVIEVSELQALQYSKWLSKKLSADYMFNLLQLKKNGDKLFDSPVLSTWSSYVAKKNPGREDETMFSVLQKHYKNDILAKMFSEAKEKPTMKIIASRLEGELWQSEGQTAGKLFTTLKLDETGEGLFEAPMFASWAAYVKRLSQYEKNPNEFVIFSELEKRYDYVDLARMLYNAERQADNTSGAGKDTVKLLSALRKQQYKQWMTEKGLDPERLSLIITRRQDSRNNGVLLGFYDFYRANGGPKFV
ncbi:hypothetical protein F442_20362 [Phytophthora nicotianae P10297]|uniref:RxLR effector protein n=1 Tax=Phytophthora nicotianae P10297 TaxID=1317064 RepID=W2Y7S2_PHYNI|nr:hypothetical protein F442_20362 [Phytophthora nicotianae P10297]